MRVTHVIKALDAVATDPSRGAPTPGDRRRSLAVLVSAVVAVVGSFIGSGAVVGTPIAEAAGGALSASATLVAPGGPAFGIWSVIYLGLVALALVQLLPSRRTDPRHRATGWWIAASLLLNAAWILSIQAGLLRASAVVIVALLAVLVVVLVRLARTPARTRLDGLLLDGVVGLYLGWVSIATVANLAAVLADAGVAGADVDPTGAAPTAWAVLVLVVAAGVGVLLALGGRGRRAPGLALAWGLAWIAAARTGGQPESIPVAVVAALAAGVAVAAPEVVRARTRAAARTTARTTDGAPIAGSGRVR